MDTETTEMTYEMAEAIFARYDIGAWDWAVWEDVLTSHTKEQVELADAFALVWRRYCDDPGFRQPSGSLVETVENIIGEPVWTEGKDE